MASTPYAPLRRTGTATPNRDGSAVAPSWGRSAPKRQRKTGDVRRKPNGLTGRRAPRPNVRNRPARRRIVLRKKRKKTHDGEPGLNGAPELANAKAHGEREKSPGFSACTAAAALPTEVEETGDGGGAKKSTAPPQVAPPARRKKRDPKTENGKQEHDLIIIKV